MALGDAAAAGDLRIDDVPSARVADLAAGDAAEGGEAGQGGHLGVAGEADVEHAAGFLDAFDVHAGEHAGAIAAALGAERLFMLTDVVGVLDKNGELVTDLDPAGVAALRADGTIKGGMIPKLETCVHAVEGGVDAAVILDGRVPHAMLLEIFTRGGAGTLVRR